MDKIFDQVNNSRKENKQYARIASDLETIFKNMLRNRKNHISGDNKYYYCRLNVPMSTNSAELDSYLNSHPTYVNDVKNGNLKFNTVINERNDLSFYLGYKDKYVYMSILGTYADEKLL